MKLLKPLLFTALFGGAVSANAFVLSDVQEYNAPLVNSEYMGFRFNLAELGYNHRTDTITDVTLSFDFREIVETEEDFSNPDDMSTWEFVIFYSWIFDGRSVHADVDTGTLSFSLHRDKTYECQYYDNVDGEEVCVENLDLYGSMTTWFVPYTDNLWLGEVRLDAEISRVPEPAPLLLFGLGLMGLGLKQRRHLKRFKSETIIE